MFPEEEEEVDIVKNRGWGLIEGRSWVWVIEVSALLERSEFIVVAKLER